MQTVVAGGLPIGDGHPPRIMGVLNVSEESPYDPSVFADPAAAARYVEEELAAEGADIVDVGLETANKRFEVRTAEEELRRLDAAVAVRERAVADVVWSIETRYAAVADEALSRGFDMVNDVCGFADPAMPEVCAAHDAAVVKMASPPDLDRPGAVEETDWVARKGREWAEAADYVDMVYEALAQRGFTERTILDPAFGGWSRAKTLREDRETFRRLREFRGHGRPLLVSINRKNFLRAIADRSTEAALPASLAGTAMAVARGAHVVRTHDVAETRDAALVGRELSRERVRRKDGVAVEELDVRTSGDARRHLDRLGAGQEHVTASTVRWFEVTGLSGSDRELLDERASAVDATLVDGNGMVPDGDGTVGDSDGAVVDREESVALLYGTVGALASLARSISGESPALTAIAGCLRADIGGEKTYGG